MICIIDCGTFWLHKIKQNVSDLGYRFRIIKPREIKNFNFKFFSGIIISGAPKIFAQRVINKYLNHFKFMKSIRIPVLGICLGHQIIGLLYGSEIKSGKRINKMEQIKIIKKDRLFAGILKISKFREKHSKFISLPKNFILLAKSYSCDNEAMRHKNKRIYGVQFHPESSKNVGKMIFRNFLKMCKSD